MEVTSQNPCRGVGTEAGVYFMHFT